MVLLFKVMELLLVVMVFFICGDWAVVNGDSVCHCDGVVVSQ